MSESKFLDEVQSFSIQKTTIRGRLVRLGKAYSDLLCIQDYPVQVASLLGELTSVAVALADSLKYNGQFILQTKSKGPVSTMVSHVKYNGTFRSYANYNKQELKNHADEQSLVALLGNGQIAFTVDQGKNTKRYQGITNLEGENLAECVQNYFQKSEQIATSIILVAEPEQKRAAALMIQQMPHKNDNSNLVYDESTEKIWLKANLLMQSIRSQELLDYTTNPENLLYRYFNQTGVRFYDKKNIKYKCHCSKENIATSLANFSSDELDQMRNDKGLISATCEFCSTLYTYSKQNLLDSHNSTT